MKSSNFLGYARLTLSLSLSLEITPIKKMLIMMSRCSHTGILDE